MKVRMSILVFLGALGVSFARDNLLQNGSFESYVKAPLTWTYPYTADLQLSIGNTDITGWTTIIGHIDYVANSAGTWRAADGERSLDLCGDPGSGGVSQTFATEPNATYLVQFHMSGNPLTGYVAPYYVGEDLLNKTLRVQVAGQSADFSYDRAVEQNSMADMKWKLQTFVFVADSNSTTLDIFSTMGLIGVGPVIDNVQVFKIASPYQSINGEIVEQQLSYSDQGYTVIRLWGSYYEMGYAHAHLLGDYIVDGVNQTRAILQGGTYDDMRQFMDMQEFMDQDEWPPTIEKELDGMVDSLASTHPEAGIDKLALKVFNALGDLAYACRSHICWDRYVAEPIKTLATRRMDLHSIIPLVNCHVLCAYDPNDGSPRWVNMTWPGLVTVVTGLNEYGTIVSSHDYQSHITDLTVGRTAPIPRVVAFSDTP